MTCTDCQQPKLAREVRTCWCQRDLCRACLAAHLPTCEQRGKLLASTPTVRPDPTPAKIAAGFRRLRETMREMQAGTPAPPRQKSAVRRWWDD